MVVSAMRFLLIPFLNPILSISLPSFSSVADLRHCDALDSRGTVGRPGFGTGRIWTPTLPVRRPVWQNGRPVTKSLLHHAKLGRGHAWPAGGTGTYPLTTYS